MWARMLRLTRLEIAGAIKCVNMAKRKDGERINAQSNGKCISSKESKMSNVKDVDTLSKQTTNPLPAWTIIRKEEVLYLKLRPVVKAELGKPPFNMERKRKLIRNQEPQAWKSDRR